MTTPYFEAFRELAHINLPDSWVLSIEAFDGALRFGMDFVIAPSHPDYRGPLPGEHYDYRRGSLRALGEDLQYEASGAQPATDATGEEYFGHIDSWLVRPTGEAALSGERGEVFVRNARVFVELEPRGVGSIGAATPAP